jgi:hypothetical protein
MRNFLAIASGVLVAGLVLPIGLRAQAGLPADPSKSASSAAADLSGSWSPDGKRGGVGQSFSLSDPQGKQAGAETDVPYLPWAQEKTKAEKASAGPTATFEGTTDPVVKYCDPYGVPRIYMSPSKVKFVQTPEAVYILYEYGPTWRPIWLNRKHSEDPDPTWWGESIGWYENADTLVVDTIGFNDKTWLDQVGHPHTEKLHVIERYRRLDKDSLQLDVTIDDPGAYTKPWQGHRFFTSSSKVPFAKYFWICSVSENEHFKEGREGKLDSQGNPTSTH